VRTTFRTFPMAFRYNKHSLNSGLKLKISSYIKIAQLLATAIFRHPAKATGSCLCNNIMWEVSGRILLCINCHCSICRTIHGASFATVGVVSNSKFRWVQGEKLIRRFRSSRDGHRNFCSKCGSALPHSSDPGSSIMMVQMGCLAGSCAIYPQLHLFTDSRAHWYSLPDDGLPRFPTYPEWLPGTPIESKLEHSTGKGGCLCGKVIFQFDGTPTELVNCYCSLCRKSTGSAFSTNAQVSSAEFHWIFGAQHVESFHVPDSKFVVSFCKECGSLLPSVRRLSVKVPMGSISLEAGPMRFTNQYTESKAEWYKSNL
jgi:hypothetical protein